jgi:histidinol-phosphatase (PHP family)
LIADYHMHLRNEGEEVTHHADAIEPFVETAQATGVDEIGFSEHVYYFRQTRPLWSVPYHTERCVYDIERYVDAVVEAKRRGLPVKLGLEVDYVPGREAETRELLAPYPWDYVLGSIHYIDGLGIDSTPRLTDAVGVDAAWSRYFETLCAAARSGVFDALSHPDLVKIFGDRADRALQDELHDAAAEAAADGGVAVEVSTAGLRKPVGEMYPAPEFLRACRGRGVAVTTASDAHVPSLVGHAFGRARALLRECGYETTTFFERREARQVALDG